MATGVIISSGVQVLFALVGDLGVGPTMLIGATITLLGLVVSLPWARETTNLALPDASALSANPQPGAEPTTAEPTGTVGR